jgi:hypothetical protein
MTLVEKRSLGFVQVVPDKNGGILVIITPDGQTILVILNINCVEKQF